MNRIPYPMKKYIHIFSNDTVIIMKENLSQPF